MPPSPAIAVVGSINLDLVARAERLPRPGETLTDATFERIPGGKGANQALAAARLGASVRLVGAVGDDPFADEALVLLQEGGVDLERVRRVHDTTGVALILVGGDGENEIVVAPGANRSVAAGGRLRRRRGALPAGNPRRDGGRGRAAGTVLLSQRSACAGAPT